MKVGDALKSVQRIYLETAPLIYYVETNPTYVAKMDIIIDQIEKRLIEAATSTITLTEVLTFPLKHGDKKLEQEYRDILLQSGDLLLIAVTE